MILKAYFVFLFNDVEQPANFLEKFLATRCITRKCPFEKFDHVRSRHANRLMMSQSTDQLYGYH